MSSFRVLSSTLPFITSFRSSHISRLLKAYAIKSFIARLAKIAATTIKNVAQWLVWVAKEIGQLTDIELHRADGEVNDVVDGKYDWRIGKLENHNGLVR